MHLLWKIFRRSNSVLSPRQGYRLWAAHYESPDNLMQQLDRQLVGELLQSLNLAGKHILDFGCGTGRYWTFLKGMAPATLIGCDPSPEMLSQLRKKHPGAIVHQLKDHLISFQATQSIDLLFSTLTIGQIPALREVVPEWDRVLLYGGNLLLTGIHPEALKTGVKRSFSEGRKTYNIQNHLHELADIRKALTKIGWEEIDFRELEIRVDHRPHFAKAGALKSYEWIKGMPVIYGMLWEKKPLQK